MKLAIQISCAVLVLILIQSVSLYKILDTDDLTHQVLDEQRKQVDVSDELSNPSEPQTKRLAGDSTDQKTIERRSGKAHFNPLVAAYKRCRSFPIAEERDECFKNAVQMLFVYKL